MSSEKVDSKKLQAAIILQSEADTFAEAKLEWDLRCIRKGEVYGDTQCLCGHDILNHCHLHNKRNGKRVIVGSKCVDKFVNKEIGASALFSSLDKIHQDTSSNMSRALILHVYEADYINEWEKGFLMDMLGKRKLSPKQFNLVEKINKRVLKLAKYI